MALSCVNEYSTSAFSLDMREMCDVVQYVDFCGVDAIMYGRFGRNAKKIHKYRNNCLKTACEYDWMDNKLRKVHTLS